MERGRWVDEKVTNLIHTLSARQIGSRVCVCEKGGGGGLSMWVD